MRQTEETARAICALDLRSKGFPDNEIGGLVDRYWPVLANEIRQGVMVGAGPFSAEDIEALTREYTALLESR